MYDPCVRCPCILRREVCRSFCTTYKAAVREDVRKGLVEIGRATHDRLVRAEK